GREGMALAASLGNQHLIGLAGAIRSPSGDVRGGFVALRSRESELAAFNALRRTMVWAVALGVVLALIFAFVQARQIAGPVRRRGHAADCLGTHGSARRRWRAAEARCHFRGPV